MTTYSGTSGFDKHEYSFASNNASYSWASDSKNGDGVIVTYNSSLASTGGSKTGSTTGGSKTGSSTGSTSGSETTSDTFYNFERIQFKDYTLALDYEWSESAGAALALINAGFGSFDDISFEDVGRWVHTADEYKNSDSKSGIDPHMRVESVAQSMVDFYAPNISNEDLVNILYTNVIGEAPTPSQLDYYVQLLENGDYTKAGLFALAAESDLNTDDYYSDSDGHTIGLYYTPFVDSKT